MTTGTSGIGAPGNIDLYPSNDAAAAAGASNFLPNVDAPSSALPTADGVTIAGTPVSTVAAGPSQVVVVPGDQSNYVPNSNAHNDAVNSGAGAINSAQSAADSINNDLATLDFTVEIDGGYEGLDAERATQYLAKLSILANIEMELLMTMDGAEEISQKIREILLELPTDDTDNTIDRTQFIKSVKENLKNAQQLFAKTLKRVMLHNQQILEARLKAIEQEKEDRSFWGDVGNFFSGGGDDIRIEEKKRDEIARYNAAQKQILSSFAGALDNLADTFQGSGRGELAALGASCRRMADKIEEVEASLVTSNYEDQDYLDEDDIGNLFQDLLTDIRSQMTAAENVYRALAYAKTAQEEISQSVRESIQEISPHSSKADYVNVASEGHFNLINMVFDASFNTLMGEVRTYNNLIQQSKNIQKLKDAQGWRVLGSIGICIAMVAAIVVTCLTAGGGSPLIAGVAAVGVAAGVAGGIAQGYGTYLAVTGVEDSYDIGDPNFTVGGSSKGGEGKSAASILERAEREEEALAQRLRSQSLYTKTKDGFYMLNTKALAAFEIAQSSIHNLMRMVMTVDRAQRNLSRTIRAIIYEKGIRDFGEAYLNGNIENSIQQRTMMTQAIKFQLQEGVTSRNIHRQQEMQASAALWSCISAPIGMVVGFLLSLVIPGVGYMMGMAIGSALGGAINGYVQATKSSSAYEMKFEMTSKEFTKLVEERRNANRYANTAEGRISQLEDEIILNLMSGNNLLVDTGDGYHGLNYGKIGQAYSMLQRLANLREAIAMVRAGKDKISAAIRQQINGVSSNAVDLMSMAAKARFSAGMTILGAIVKNEQEKVGVMNRARDGEKAADRATVNLGITVALSVIGVGGGMATSSPSGQTPTAANNAFNYNTSAVMSLCTSIATLWSDVAASKDDLGYYNNYNSNEMAKNVKGKRPQQSNNPIDQIEALEYQAFVEAGENLAKTIHGGNWGVDQGMAATLTQRLQTLNNIRQIFSALVTGKQELSSNVRQKLGMATAGETDISFVSDNAARSAQSIMNCLVQTVDTIVERHNQIDAATRQVYMDSVNLAFSVAALAMTVVSSVYDFSASSDRAMATDPKSADAPKTTDAEKAKFKFSADSKSGTSKAWYNASMITGVFSGLSTFYTGKIYDAVKSNDHNTKHSSVKQSALDNKKAQGKGDAPRAEGDIYAGMSAMDADIAASEISIADSSTATSVEFSLQQAEMMIKTWLGFIESSASTTSRIYNGQKEADEYARLQEKKDKVAAPETFDPTKSNAVALAEAMPAQEKDALAASLLARVERGEISMAQARPVLSAIQPKLTGATADKVKVALNTSPAPTEQKDKNAEAAAAAAAKPAETKPASNTTFQPEQKPTSSSKGLLEYAEKFFDDIAAKLEEVFTSTDAEPATAAKPQGQPAASAPADQAAKPAAAGATPTTSTAPVATAGERPATTEEQLNAKYAEKEAKIKDFQAKAEQLKVELPAAEKAYADYEKAAGKRLAEIDEKINEYRAKPALSGEEVDDYEQLKGERDQIVADRDHRKVQLNKLREHAKEYKTGGKIQKQLMGELRAVQGQIIKLEAQLKKERAEAAKAAASRPTAASQGPVKVGALGFQPNYYRDAEQKRRDEEMWHKQEATVGSITGGSSA